MIVVEASSNASKVGCGGRAPDSQALQSVTSSNSVFSVRTWTHIVCTFDITNNSVLVYVNGVLAPTTGTPAFTNTTWDNTDSGGIAIGHAPNGLAGNQFSGKLDDVRIYNRALSASEIKQLYNMGR